MNIEVSERDIVYVCQLLTIDPGSELVTRLIVNCDVAPEKIEERPTSAFDIMQLSDDVGFNGSAPEGAWVL